MSTWFCAFVFPYEYSPLNSLICTTTPNNTCYHAVAFGRIPETCLMVCSVNTSVSRTDLAFTAFYCSHRLFCISRSEMESSDQGNREKEMIIYFFGCTEF